MSETSRRETISNEKIPSQFIFWGVTTLCIVPIGFCFCLPNGRSTRFLRSEIALYMISICITWILFCYPPILISLRPSTLTAALHITLSSALSLSILHNLLLDINPSIHILFLCFLPHLFPIIFRESKFWIRISNFLFITLFFVALKLVFPFFSFSSSSSAIISWPLIFLYAGLNCILFVQFRENQLKVQQLQQNYELVATYNQQSKTALFSQLLGNVAHDLNTVKNNFCFSFSFHRFILSNSVFFFYFFSQ
jgi:hypothetical protein